MTVTPPVMLECTVAEVASHIRARTKDKNGNEVGTFTVDTRPTYEQAQEAIDNAVKFLRTKVVSVGPGCQDAAQAAVALLAAADIERSYFPEQSRGERSVYQFLREAADNALEGVYQCVLGNLPDAEGEGGHRSGTVTVVSGVVYDHYTGVWWPPIPVPPVPEPEPEVDNGSLDNGDPFPGEP